MTQSTTGSVDLKDLGIDGAGAVATGVHAVLSRCLHTLNLFKVLGHHCCHDRAGIYAIVSFSLRLSLPL